METNMRRGYWTPTIGSRLCEIHFEDSQFEQNRQDGWKNLKPNAVPTLFYVPNPPQMFNSPPRKSVYKKDFTKKLCKESGSMGSPIDERENLVNNIEPANDLEPITLLCESESLPDVSGSSESFTETEKNERIKQLEKQVGRWREECEQLKAYLKKKLQEKCYN